MKEHSWRKENLVTISDKHGIYDKYRCTECGVTAKRFGFGEPRRDKKFKHERFADCDSAKDWLDLEKKKERKRQRRKERRAARKAAKEGK